MHIALKIIEILLVALVTYFARSRPESIFGRYALKEFHLFTLPPEPNESEFDYLKRRSLWTFMWFIQILIICVVAWYLFDSLIDSYMIIGFITRFALPVLAGICLMRCGILYIKAFFCRMGKTRKVFRGPDEGFVVDEYNATY